jgi:hypothetical protein
MVLREQKEKGQYALSANEIWELLKEQPSMAMHSEQSNIRLGQKIGGTIGNYIRKRKNVPFMSVATVEKRQLYALKVIGMHQRPSFYRV